MKMMAIWLTAVLSLFLQGGGGANWDGTLYIEAEEPGIITSSFYYWEGDSDSDSLYFFSDGTFDYDSPGSETLEGTWFIDGDMLIITVDGEEMECTVEDGGRVIANSYGDRMILAGTTSESGDSSGSIFTSYFYYLYGDSDSDSLYFFSDNTVDFDSPGEATEKGTYSIYADTLIITWDSGTEDKLTIEDGGATVIGEQGECYYWAE